MPVRYTYGDLKKIKREQNIKEPIKRKKEPSKEKKDKHLLFCHYFDHKGIKAVTEHRFHPKRLWRFDIAFPDLKIAVEVEGGVWSNGRHTRGSGFINDMEKYNAATSMGWYLLRTTPDFLLSGKFLDVVETTIKMVTAKNT